MKQERDIYEETRENITKIFIKNSHKGHSPSDSPRFEQRQRKLWPVAELGKRKMENGKWKMENFGIFTCIF